MYCSFLLMFKKFFEILFVLSVSIILFQEENVSKHIQKAFSIVDSKSAYKSPNITNITEKLRAENKLFSQDNRLKVKLIYEPLQLLLVVITRCPYILFIYEV